MQLIIFELFVFFSSDTYLPLYVGHPRNSVGVDCSILLPHGMVCLCHPHQPFSVSIFCHRQLKVSNNVWADHVCANSSLGQETHNLAVSRRFMRNLKSLTLINLSLSSNWPTLTNTIDQALVTAHLGCLVSIELWHSAFINNACTIAFLIINECYDCCVDHASSRSQS